MIQRRASAVLLAALAVFAACGTELPAASDGSSNGRATTTTPSIAATTTTLPAPTTTTLAPSTTTTAPAEIPEENPEEDTEEDPESEVTAGGPGVEHQVLIAALAPLVDAESAMHAFEADWDAGMTYSETFRGWREVKVIVSEAFDVFALPTDASAEQILAADAYVVAVQDAHDEWQAVTDFIVTYITNYTPEVLILEAYANAEFRLRDAIAAYDVIETMATY